MQDAGFGVGNLWPKWYAKFEFCECSFDAKSRIQKFSIAAKCEYFSVIFHSGITMHWGAGAGRSSGRGRLLGEAGVRLGQGLQLEGARASC